MEYYIRKQIVYKKITHTIVEEHFDCPEAVDIAASVDSSNGIMPMKFRVTPALPMSTDQFKIRVEDWFLETDAANKDLARATFDSSLDYEQAIENVFLNIDGLGNTLKGYYGSEMGERWNQLWRSVSMNLMYIWRNIKNNWDNTLQEERLHTLLGDALTLVLNQYNTAWDRYALKPVIDDLFTGYTEFGQALKDKNTSKISAAETKIATALEKLNTAVSSGVIQQFPGLFTTP